MIGKGNVTAEPVTPETKADRYDLMDDEQSQYVSWMIIFWVTLYEVIEFWQLFQLFQSHGFFITSEQL